MNKSKFVWTDEKIDYLLENWGKESAHSMKLKFGCTWYSVVKKATELGLEKPKNNSWTAEDIIYLKELSDKYHYEEIAKIMNRTPNAIYLKAKRVGITLIMDRREWTIEEEKYLKNQWGKVTIEYLAKKMKRSIFSLKVKAVRMGLGSMISNYLDDILISDISEILNVGVDRIYDTWIRKGLNIKEVRISKNKKYMAVTLEDLLTFLKNNQDEWDSKDLELNILGLEPQWLIEKRKADIWKDYHKYRKWTKDELQKIKDMLLNGKDYEYMAKTLNRSVCAIASMLHSEGYSYRLKRYWKGKEIIYLRDNYHTMTYKQIAQYLGRTTKAVAAKAEELGFQKKKKRN